MLLFKSISFNSISIVNKITDLNYLFESKHLDCVFISKTWLNGSLTDGFVCHPDFNIFRKDGKTQGGGVYIITTKSLSAFSVQIPFKFDQLDVVCIEIVFNHTLYILVNVYCPPRFSVRDGEICDGLIAYLNYVGSGRNRSTLVVSGEFNLPDIDWVNGVAPDDGVQLKLFNCFVALDASQLINHPTRNDTLLDLLFTNDPDCFRSFR